MAKKFLTSIDLNGNQLIKPVLENVATNPPNELIEKGRIAFNTTGNVPIVYDGSSWKNLQYEIPDGTYLTPNDTITLSGVINGSGSGRTGITTSIDNGKLSIANTSGLQDALNSKMTTASYPSLTAIQALANTSGFLKKTGASTWEIDTNTYLKSNANAVSATVLKNPRAFSITGGATAEAISFNGESNVVLDVTAIDPSKITQSEDYRLVTDTEKSDWNKKETPGSAQTKANKALADAKDYVDGKVLTDVPTGALFSDTITTINGKTGAITKDDIVELGIPGDISSKVDKVDGYGLSANDFTTVLKNKLDGIPTDATNLKLGETETTAYRGDRGQAAYTHITDTTKHITAGERTAWNAKATIADAQDKAAAALTEANLYTDGEIKTVNTSLDGKSDETHNHNLADLDERSYDSLTGTPSLGTAASLNTGIASGNIPVLGVGGKLNDSIIPKIAISDTFVIATQALMLALTAEVGDVAIRTDINKSFILKGDNAKVLENWQELLTPMSPVTSVAGRVGDIELAKDDVGLSNVNNTSDAAKPVSTAQQTALNLKVDKVNGKGLSSNDYTKAEKTKLGGIEAEANKYIHPEYHLASEITESSTRKFVTQAQIDSWTAKSSEGAIPTGELGQYLRGDKTWATLNTDAVTEGDNEYYTDTKVANYVDSRYLGKTETASKASELATAKNFSIGGETGLTATAVSFNGSEHVSLDLKGTLGTGYGGTGFTNPKDGITRKVKGKFTTEATSHTITHSLGDDIIAQVFTSSGELVECDINSVKDKVTFGFNVAPTANSLKYVIIG